GFAPLAVRGALEDHDGAGAVIVAQHGDGGDAAAHRDGGTEGVAAVELLRPEAADGRDARVGVVAGEAMDRAVEAAGARRADPDLAAVHSDRGAEAVPPPAIERGEAADLLPFAGRIVLPEGEDAAAHGIDSGRAHEQQPARDGDAGAEEVVVLEVPRGDPAALFPGTGGAPLPDLDGARPLSVAGDADEGTAILERDGGAEEAARGGIGAGEPGLVRPRAVCAAAEDVD